MNREPKLDTIDKPISLRKDASLGGEKTLARAMSALRYEFERSLEGTTEGQNNLNSLESLSTFDLSTSVLSAQSTFDGIDDNCLGKDATSFDRLMAALRYSFGEDDSLHRFEKLSSMDRSAKTMTSKSTFDSNGSSIDSVMGALHSDFSDSQKSIRSLLEQQSKESTEKVPKLKVFFSSGSADSGFLGMVQHALRALNESDDRNKADDIVSVEEESQKGTVCEKVGTVLTTSITESQTHSVVTTVIQEEKFHDEIGFIAEKLSDNSSEQRSITIKHKMKCITDEAASKEIADGSKIDKNRFETRTNLTKMKLEEVHEDLLTGTPNSLMVQSKLKRDGVIHEIDGSKIALQCKSNHEKGTSPTSTIQYFHNDILCKNNQTTSDVKGNDDDEGSTLLCGCRAVLSENDLETDNVDHVPVTTGPSKEG